MTKYKKVTPEIAAQLQAIVGAKRFFAGDAVKDDFSHDEMPIYGKYYPEVVCEAESTEEVSAILRVCYENDIPVTPRGAGTGLVGGCVPLCGGVVLCTTRMNKILSYDMNNLVVHIQPGVLLCDLAADALHLLEQCDPRAVLRRRNRGHHAGGTGADDEDVLHRSTPASS